MAKLSKQQLFDTVLLKIKWKGAVLNCICLNVVWKRKYNYRPKILV